MKRGLLAVVIIDPKAKPDKRQKNLQKAIEKLLNNYPPQTKKQNSGCVEEWKSNSVGPKPYAAVSEALVV